MLLCDIYRTCRVASCVGVQMGTVGITTTISAWMKMSAPKGLLCVALQTAKTLLVHINACVLMGTPSTLPCLSVFRFVGMEFHLPVFIVK